MITSAYYRETPVEIHSITYSTDEKTVIMSQEANSIRVDAFPRAGQQVSVDENGQLHCAKLPPQDIPDDRIEAKFPGHHARRIQVFSEIEEVHGEMCAEFMATHQDRAKHLIQQVDAHCSAMHAQAEQARQDAIKATEEALSAEAKKAVHEMELAQLSLEKAKHEADIARMKAEKAALEAPDEPTQDTRVPA